MTLCSGGGGFCDTGLRGWEEGRVERVGGRGEGKMEGDDKEGLYVYTHRECMDVKQYNADAK